MNVFNHLHNVLNKVLDALQNENVLPEEISRNGIVVEPPREKSHGDIAVNAALVLAKQARMNPRELAAKIVEKLVALEIVDDAEIAGPGFINLRLTDDFWRGRLADILKADLVYGASEVGAAEKVNVEYVSANPTGPMHVGHVRGAVFGDALANLLTHVGYDVTKEYYVNDAGSQIDTLARSLYLRYQEALGEEIGEIPEGLYPGEYLIPLAEEIAEREGDRFQTMEEDDWLGDFKAVAVEAMMKLIKDDLAALGIHHDVFSFETELHAAGRIPETIAFLRKKGLIYEGILEPPKGKKPDDWEPREQTLFKSTDFGDDVDRALAKSDGSYTYFAADIAYHYDKVMRKFDHLVDVLGADHGGYAKRIQAAVNALSGGEVDLDVRLCQMVKLFRGGEPVKMSKRSGQFVTLREVVDEVGSGVVRFIMLTRKNDAHLDFDFEKVKEQSRDNPVFYVQYAHARAHSAFRKAKELMPDLDAGLAALEKADLGLLGDEGEIALIKAMASWPRIVEGAAAAHEPHRVAFYLYDLASDFHSHWNKGNDDPGLRFVLEGQEQLTLARLALVRAVGFVIAEGLEVLGVEPLEEMH